jgi:hypothetical protein
VLVHGPIHASWLNQIESYFSIVQRNALTPNDFSSVADVEEVCCGSRPSPSPSSENTRAHLDELVKKIDAASTVLRPAA